MIISFSMLLSSFVPYDTSVWQKWWAAIMMTIGSAAAIGFVVFTVIMGISVFKLVLRHWTGL